MTTLSLFTLGFEMSFSDPSKWTAEMFHYWSVCRLRFVLHRSPVSAIYIMVMLSRLLGLNLRKDALTLPRPPQLLGPWCVLVVVYVCVQCCPPLNQHFKAKCKQGQRLICHIAVFDNKMLLLCVFYCHKHFRSSVYVSEDPPEEEDPVMFICLLAFSKYVD